MQRQRTRTNVPPTFQNGFTDNLGDDLDLDSGSDGEQEAKKPKLTKVKKYLQNRSHLYTLFTEDELKNFYEIEPLLKKTPDTCGFHTVTKVHAENLVNGFCFLHFVVVFNTRFMVAYIDGERVIIPVGFNKMKFGTVKPIFPLLAFVPELKDIKQKTLAAYIYEEMRALEIYENCKHISARAATELSALAVFMDHILSAEKFTAAELTSTSVHFNMWKLSQAPALKTRETQESVLRMTMDEPFYNWCKAQPRFAETKWFQTGYRESPEIEKLIKEIRYVFEVPFKYLTDFDKQILNSFLPTGKLTRSRYELCGYEKKQKRSMFENDESILQTEIRWIPNIVCHNGVLVMGAGCGIPFGCKPLSPAVMEREKGKVIVQQAVFLVADYMSATGGNQIIHRQYEKGEGVVVENRKGADALFFKDKCVVDKKNSLFDENL